MAITARARPIPVGAAARPPSRPGARPMANSAATVSPREVTPPQMTQLVAQGVMIAGAILAVIGGIIFFFGDTMRGHLFPIAAPPAGVQRSAPGTAPTVFYRDRGDGTFVVMEIDGNGTRVKGTVARDDVPLLQADKVREGWGSSNVNPNARVNALGSSFR